MKYITHCEIWKPENLIDVTEQELSKTDMREYDKKAEEKEEWKIWELVTDWIEVAVKDGKYINPASKDETQKDKVQKLLIQREKDFVNMIREEITEDNDKLQVNDYDMKETIKEYISFGVIDNWKRRWNLQHGLTDAEEEKYEDWKKGSNIIV